MAPSGFAAAAAAHGILGALALAARGTAMVQDVRVGAGAVLLAGGTLLLLGVRAFILRPDAPSGTLP